MKKLLVISPNSEGYTALREYLSPEYRALQQRTWKEGRAALRESQFDLIFLDLSIFGTEESHDKPDAFANLAAAGLREIRHLAPATGVILLCTLPELRFAADAIRVGAAGYLRLPFERWELELALQTVRREQQTGSELAYLRDRVLSEEFGSILDSRNPQMKAVLDQIRAVAPTRSSVLLLGETGTGKGVLARAIHRLSTRSNGPFVAVHCGAVPDTLIEAEFFGHEKGAFTGAVKRKLGKFEIADGGTIFLDEIATISPQAQVKLLRVLQERSFERVGGENSIESDIRIVSASNIDLKQMVDDGVFRSDLYYRLNVFPLRIPPLRERKEDIPVICRAVLENLNGQHHKSIEGFHPLVLDALSAYPWPGNIRELENVLERAYVLETQSIFMPESFPSELFAFKPQVSDEGQIFSLAEARRRGIESIESLYLNDLLSRHQGRIKESAGAAGITSRQLHKLMKKYGIRKEVFRRNRN